MTTITLPSGKYLLIKVPPTAHDFKVCNMPAYCWVSYLYNPVFFPSGGSMSDMSPLIDLPVGTYSIISLASAITEDVAAGIVGYGNTTTTHAESLYSLVRSHGMEPEITLIIKIEES